MIYGVSGLLIAAAAGYWVLTQSTSQKGRVKQLGQFLGLLIIVISVLGAGCKLYFQWSGQACPMGRGGWKAMCPITGKSIAPSAP